MNQHQLTMTAGDERMFTFTVADDFEADSATLVVEGLFSKGAAVGADDGSGYATVSFTVTEDDTEDCGDYRHAHRYAVRVDDEGATKTIARGLFVVVPRLEAP